jgi:hypothetical protein
MADVMPTGFERSFSLSSSVSDIFFFFRIQIVRWKRVREEVNSITLIYWMQRKSKEGGNST